MISSARHRRVVLGAGIALFLLSPLQADEPGTIPPPKSHKPTPAQLRSTAEAAEKAGDWEAAYSAYCHLFVADRTAPDVREKLNTALYGAPNNFAAIATRSSSSTSQRLPSLAPWTSSRRCLRGFPSSTSSARPSNSASPLGEWNRGSWPGNGESDLSRSVLR